jgi:hypothetical protein
MEGTSSPAEATSPPSSLAVHSGATAVGAGIDLMLVALEHVLPGWFGPTLWYGLFLIGAALFLWGVKPLVERIFGQPAMPIFLMIVGVGLFFVGTIWLVVDNRRSATPDVSAPPASPKKFYSAQDRENLANLCTQLVGFLRENGGDGGGNGAWKMVGTLGNDWIAQRGKDRPDLALLDGDLIRARISVASLWDGLYGPSSVFKKYDAYYEELNTFFPPSEDYPGQIRALQRCRRGVWKFHLCCRGRKQ